MAIRGLTDLLKPPLELIRGTLLVFFASLVIFFPLRELLAYFGFFPVTDLLIYFAREIRPLPFRPNYSPHDALLFCLPLTVVYAVAMAVKRTIERRETRNYELDVLENASRRHTLKTIKVAVSCVGSLLVIMFVCIGFAGQKTILLYASRDKPYSTVLSLQGFEALKRDTDARLVIYLGDSNSFNPPDAFANTGNPKTHMPQLISKAIAAKGGKQDFIFSEWAFAAADMFDFYCLFHVAIEHSPDLVIIPINWRSFGSAWINEATWFFPELSALVPINEGLPSDIESPVRLRGISVIQRFAYKAHLYLTYPIGLKNLTKEKAKFLLPMDGDSAMFATGTNTLIQARPKFTNSGTKRAGPAWFEEKPFSNPDYPSNVGESNPTFRSLFALIHTASRHRTKVLFFIWPIPPQTLADFTSSERLELERSKRSVMAATEKPDISCVDFPELLTQSHFSDSFGHCKVEGRKKIAEALTPVVLDVLNQGCVNSE